VSVARREMAGYQTVGTFSAEKKPVAGNPATGF